MRPALHVRILSGLEAADLQTGGDSKGASLIARMTVRVSSRLAERILMRDPTVGVVLLCPPAT
eukprot:1164361-Pyramimonas_sp.AAC.1